MATIKAYSVARTQKSYDPATATAASTVYSTSETHSGRALSYDYGTPQGGKEGRIPTLVVSGQTITGTATALVLTNAGSAQTEYADGDYILTTTTVTGSGAGLIIRGTVASGVLSLASTPIVDGGGSYDAGDTDTVSIDGWSGTVVTVTV